MPRLIAGAAGRTLLTEPNEGLDEEWRHHLSRITGNLEQPTDPKACGDVIQRPDQTPFSPATAHTPLFLECPAAFAVCSIGAIPSQVVRQ